MRVLLRDEFSSKGLVNATAAKNNAPIRSQQRENECSMLNYLLFGDSVGSLLWRLAGDFC